MTWAAVLANGFGAIEYRLEIEGWPYQFVTHPDMEQVMGDTRERVACLSRDGFEWEESCDFVIPDLEGSAPVVKFIETHDDRRDLASMLAKRPTALLSVSATASPSTTVLAVDQDVFGEAWDPDASSSRYVHLGKEVIYASSVSATTGPAALIVVRGVWGTTAHSHFAISYQAANASSPIISDYPYSMEGRWAKLYAYGEGDNPYGDGTQIWRGFVGRDARYDGDTGWSLQLEPTHDKLKEEMFTNAGDTIEIRGINTRVQSIFQVSNGDTLTIDISGFWEDQGSFVADVNTLFESARTDANDHPADGSADWDGSHVEASYTYSGGAASLDTHNITLLSIYEEDGSVAYTGSTAAPSVSGQENEIAGRWSYRYTFTGSPTNHIRQVVNVTALNPVEPYFLATPTACFFSDAGAYQGDMDAAFYPTTAGTYRMIADPDSTAEDTNCLDGCGLVPRHNGTSSNTNANADRLYINKVPPVRTGAAPILVGRYEDGANSDLITFTALDVDPEDAYIETLGGTIDRATPKAWQVDGGTEKPSALAMTLCYGITNAAVGASTPDDPIALEYDEFFSALFGHATSVSQDVLPPLYTDVLGSSWLTASPSETWKKRQYQYVKPISFWDAASPILFMHSLVPTYDSSGELQLAAFAGYDRTPAKTIAANDVLLPGTGAPPPTLERTGQHAALTYFKIEQNQNPYTDESIGPTVEVRNVRVIDTIGPKRKIEKNWTPFAGTRDGTAIASVDKNYVPSHDDISTHLIPYFQVFGSGSYTITLPLPLKYFTFVIGDTVAINCYSLPDMNGNEGIDSTGADTYAGIVTGRKVDLTRGFVVLTIISDLLPYS